ncbi:MAG: phenylalanine--tRNA ligase subunit beta [Candidatus Latescibacterota bacterium]|nr:phenylalanine--tRNA ligase subunit beta [Candidatus Latescibacterota bacterium]
MKITRDWLRDYVDYPWDVAELVDRLTMAGLEEEAVDDLATGLDGVVVGLVLSRHPHPNADRLSLCQVDIGDSKPSAIVCGAPNVATGQKVAVILPGSRLPDGREIRRTTIRGVESAGMICSEVELGIGADASAILVLPDSYEVGSPFAPQAGLDDVLIDFEVTPNRPDCLSLLGIAREVAALGGGTLQPPKTLVEENGEKAADLARIDIGDAGGCPRYVGRVIRGVTVGPSPKWLQNRLRAVGQRPINNVVDVTNYVMLELGQPLHAFDLNKLEGRRVIVRRAHAEVRLITLDNVERELDPEILVIADGERPVALAGVMGGADSEVSEQTVDVLLEAAHFDTSRVRSCASKVGLHTESSIRFERGTDWQMLPVSSDRAAALIAEVSGGAIAPGRLDIYPQPLKSPTIRLRPERAQSLLGTPVDAATCRNILQRLGCDVTGFDAELEVAVPSYRPDLKREVDLIEEVGRIHGYHHVALAATIRGPLPAPEAANYLIQRRLRRLASSLGLDEVITTSIVDDGWVADAGTRAVRLANGPSEGVSSLRSSLIPGLFDVARRNFNQRAAGVAIFEVGRVYCCIDGEAVKEEIRIAGLMSGQYSASTWRQDARTVELSDAKGAVEGLLEGLEITLRAAEAPYFRASGCAEVIVDGESAGWVGIASQKLGESFDMDREVCIFDLHCEVLNSARARQSTDYRPLPKFPPVERDLAIVLDGGIPTTRVEEEIRDTDPNLIEDVNLFDVYSGDQVAAGKRSLAFSLRLRSPHRTLEDADADRIVAEALRRLHSAFGAQLR